MIKLMKTEIFKKTGKNILEYLRKLGGMSNVYSARRQGLEPLLPDKDAYIYATEEEIILVLMDPGTDKRLEDQDEVAWGLALTCELYRNRLQRLSKHVPNVYGVLVTSEHIMVCDDFQEIWDALDIALIDSVEGLDHLSLPVNTDDKLPVAFPLDFLYNAEFTESDLEFAEYSLCTLIDPYTPPEEREEDLDCFIKEFRMYD